MKLSRGKSLAGGIAAIFVLVIAPATWNWHCWRRDQAILTGARALMEDWYRHPTTSRVEQDIFHASMREKLGTNTIPLFVRELGATTPATEPFFTRLQMRWKNALPGTTPAERRRTANYAFISIQALDSGSQRRKVAAFTLWAFGKDVAPVLLDISRLFRDRDPSVRFDAFNVFSSLVLDNKLNLKPAAAAALPDLLAILKGPREEQFDLRSGALTVLGQLGIRAKAALPAVEAAKSDPDRKVAKAALEAWHNILDATE